MTKVDVTKEWATRMAEHEGDAEISAGNLVEEYARSNDRLFAENGRVVCDNMELRDKIVRLENEATYYCTEWRLQKVRAGQAYDDGHMAGRREAYRDARELIEAIEAEVLLDGQIQELVDVFMANSRSYGEEP